LKKFTLRAVDNYLKLYIENFIGIAYFRVPEFRKVFNECLLNKSNESIPEWVNSNWKLEEEMANEEASL
jgi:hypothetical protein